MSARFRFASAISTALDAEAAVAETAAAARKRLGEGSADIAFVFASASYGSDLDRVPALVHEALSTKWLVGCTGGGVVGGGREIEGQPALSITVAHLPGAILQAAHLSEADLPDEDAPPRAWVERLGIGPDEVAGFVVLPEPFHFPVADLAAGLDFAFPAVPKVGGVASGSRNPDGNAVFAGRTCHRRGAVVLAVGGEVAMDVLLARGCKPIGGVGAITEANRNLLLQIDHLPAVRFLEQQVAALAPADRQLVETRPLFLGIDMDPFRKELPGAGDFLIRNVMGVDPESGMMSIGELLTVGRRVQFHVMDNGTSAADLRGVLQRHKAAARPAPCGGLMFSCLGRGKRLYGQPDHDSRLFRSELADVPIAGFFCNGEIGPVHGTTHLHGYTAAFAVFRPRR